MLGPLFAVIWSPRSPQNPWARSMALACCLASPRVATLVTLIMILQGGVCPLCSPHPQGLVIHFSKWTPKWPVADSQPVFGCNWTGQNEMRHCLTTSLAVSWKAIIPLPLWVLTTSYNLHLSLGVSRREIFFPPDTVFRISIVLFIYVAVLGA